MSDDAERRAALEASHRHAKDLAADPDKRRLLLRKRDAVEPTTAAQFREKYLRKS